MVGFIWRSEVIRHANNGCSLLRASPSQSRGLTRADGAAYQRGMAEISLCQVCADRVAAPTARGTGTEIMINLYMLFICTYTYAVQLQHVRDTLKDILALYLNGYAGPLVYK